ncbi:hypothetical protein [Nocardioides sp. MH1]|uniref:hypothetical protein n=1 Tax=Nocardioides sp. MH1 TaxID=3242490 RepID=UPI003522E2D2
MCARSRTLLPLGVRGHAELRAFRDGIIGVVVEDLLGRSLVAVERLSWDSVGDLGRRDRGPARLVFDTGHALVLSGTTAWTLDLQVIEPGDDSWLGGYDYELDGGRWVLRDAALEPPFADVLGTKLTAWQPVFDEMNEVIGIRLVFGETEVPLILDGGEVTT